MGYFCYHVYLILLYFNYIFNFTIQLTAPRQEEPCTSHLFHMFLLVHESRWNRRCRRTRSTRRRRRRRRRRTGELLFGTRRCVCADPRMRHHAVKRQSARRLAHEQPRDQVPCVHRDHWRRRPVNMDGPNSLVGFLLRGSFEMVAVLQGIRRVGPRATRCQRSRHARGPPPSLEVGSLVYHTFWNISISRWGEGREGREGREGGEGE